MAVPYSTQTISGFNTSPPSDDGSIAASNEVEWQKHLDKIGTPVKDLAEDMNTELLSAFALIFGQDISVHSSNYTVLAADQGKFLSVTGTATITLLAAATAGAGFPLAIINNGTGVVTVDGNGAETINGDATVTLNPGNSIVLTCNATLWVGYIGLGDQSIKTDIVASAVNHVTITNAATSNAPDVAATGTDTNIDLQLTAKGTGIVKNSATVSGYVSGVTEYLEEDAGSFASSFDVDAVIGASWETVGPTGSGADNTWSTMDSIPDGAKWVDLMCGISDDGSASTGTLVLYAKHPAASVSTDNSRVFGTVSFRTGDSVINYTSKKIPIDSNKHFSLYLANAAASAGCLIFLNGFGL